MPFCLCDTTKSYFCILQTIFLDFTEKNQTSQQSGMYYDHSLMRLSFKVGHFEDTVGFLLCISSTYVAVYKKISIMSLSDSAITTLPVTSNANL